MSVNQGGSEWRRLRGGQIEHILWQEPISLQEQVGSGGRRYLQIDSMSEFLGVMDLYLDCGGG